MAAKITSEITSANFELIRDKIAAILATELAAQYSATSNTLFQAGVWIERFINYDKEELPAINIYLDTINYEDKTSLTSKGNYVYNIDVIVKAKDTDSDYGDKLAVFDMQKLIRVIRYILEYPGYFNLDFETNFIYTTKVSDVNFSMPQSNGDGTHTVTAQMKFNVVAEESNGQESSVEFDSAYSQIKINETDKGYLIQV